MTLPFPLWSPVLALAVALAGCSPALDWRDVRVDAAGLRLQFPCKPARQQRTVPLAGSPVVLTLLVCSADGQTFGLAHADVAEPGRVEAALRELGAAAARNVGGAVSRRAPFVLAGTTPNPASERMRLAGRLPEGRAAQMELALFAIGTQVFQASALGEQLREEAMEIFIGEIHPGR